MDRGKTLVPILLIILLAITLSSCKTSHSIAYPKEIGSKKGVKGRTDLTLNILPFKDVRSYLPENTPLFNARKQYANGKYVFCLNDESRYDKKQPVSWQVGEFLAEAVRQRGEFKEVFFNAEGPADYYLTGSIRFLKGMQVIGIDSPPPLTRAEEQALEESIESKMVLGGIVGFILGGFEGAYKGAMQGKEDAETQANMRAIARIERQGIRSGDLFEQVLISDMKLWDREKKFVADIPEESKVLIDQRSLDRGCWLIYDYVDELLLSVAAEIGEKVWTVLREKKAVPAIIDPVVIPSQ